MIFTHIDKGEDFFKIKPPQCDMIISNPPYSRRTDVLRRLYQIGKPFAMLLSSLGICEAERFRLFNKYGVQFLIPNKRVKYFNETSKETSSPPFQSWFVCWKVLPKDVMFTEI